MSRQFHIDRIWLTDTDPASLYADAGTEVYSYTGPMNLEDISRPGCWFDDGLVARDHWRFFCDRTEDNGLHYVNVLELQGRTVKEFDRNAHVPRKYR